MRYIILLVLIPFNSVAQLSVGIKFESNLSWAQVKAKAKKENKYIFLDAFTTWCSPCKYMANEIFPQSKVGDFFNKDFLNVAVQFDKTKNDNEQIKKWYKDVITLQETYKIDVYPTYLFFNSDGNLIHFIKGGSNDADDFLKKAAEAKNPATQYISLKLQYKAGRTDTLFLLTLISAAEQTGDNMDAPIFINKYLNNQKDLLTERNLKFIYNSTTKSNDIGFRILRKHPDKVDSIIGKGKSDELIKRIAFDEVVLPLIRKNGKKKNHGGGMIIYSGDIISDVNWIEVKKKLDVDFSDLSDEIIKLSKPRYFLWNNDWANFTKFVSDYIATNENKIDTNKLINYAQEIYRFCDDLKYIAMAREWVARALETNDNDATYLETYSHLLYKEGNKEAAIKLMNQILESSGSSNEELSKELEKMKRGEKTW